MKRTLRKPTCVSPKVWYLCYWLCRWPPACIHFVSGGSEVILVTSLYCCFPRMAVRNMNDLALLHGFISVGQSLTLQHFLGRHGGRGRVTHIYQAWMTRPHYPFYLLAWPPQVSRSGEIISNALLFNLADLSMEGVLLGDPSAQPLQTVGPIILWLPFGCQLSPLFSCWAEFP